MVSLSNIKTLNTSPPLPTDTIHNRDLQVLPPIIPTASSMFKVGTTTSTPSLTASASVTAISLTVTSPGASIPSVQLDTIAVCVEDTATPAATLDPHGYPCTSSKSPDSVLPIALLVTSISIALIALIGFLLHRKCGAAGARRRNGNDGDDSNPRHPRRDQKIWASLRSGNRTALDNIFRVAQRGEVRQSQDNDYDDNHRSSPHPDLASGSSGQMDSDQHRSRSHQAQSNDVEIVMSEIAEKSRQSHPAVGPEHPNVDHNMTAPVDRFGLLNVAFSTQGHSDTDPSFSSVGFSSMQLSVSTNHKRLSLIFAPKSEDASVHDDGASAVSDLVETSNAPAMSSTGFTADSSDAYHANTLQHGSRIVLPSNDVLEEAEEEEEEARTLGHENTTATTDKEDRQHRSGSEPAQTGTSSSCPEERTPTLRSDASQRSIFGLSSTQDSSASYQSGTTLNGESNPVALTSSSISASSGYGLTTMPFTSEGCQLEQSFSPLPAHEEVVTKPARAWSGYQPTQRSAYPTIVLSQLGHDTGRSTTPDSEAPSGDRSFDTLFSYNRPDPISLDPTPGYTYSRTATPVWDQDSTKASSKLRRSVLSRPPSAVLMEPIPPIPSPGVSSPHAWGRARSGSGRSALSRPSLHAVRPGSSGSMRPDSSGSSRRSLSRLGVMTPLGEDGLPFSLYDRLDLPAAPHRDRYQHDNTMSYLGVEEATMEEMESLSRTGSRPMSPVRRSVRLAPTNPHGSARRWFRSSGVVTPPPSLAAIFQPLWDSNTSPYRPRSSTASSSLVAAHGALAVSEEALAIERSQSLNTPPAQDVVAAAAEEVAHKSSPDNNKFAKSRYIPANATKVDNDASAARDGIESDGDDSIAFEELADEEDATMTAFKMDLRRRSSYPLVLNTVSSPHFPPSASGSAARFAQPHPRTQPAQTRPLPISNNRLSWSSAQTSWSDRFSSLPVSPAASQRNSLALESSARSGAETPYSLAYFSAVDLSTTLFQDQTTPIRYVPTPDPGEDEEAQDEVRSLGHSNSVDTAGLSQPFGYDAESDDGSHMSHVGELL
ncbi:unnamed protein product [Tilletia controversa]|nr:unnamed protein product [Tilletia caries]CAD6897890.1 unnamed protein product [Tilletia controversa]CAD6914331.1 unnamed protein product [Tilletia laevis]CAD6904613.1 unnamed protein product [Tilletia caries]CAD6919836.1 unnamed protein product [Tilletia laevis]